MITDVSESRRNRIKNSLRVCAKVSETTFQFELEEEWNLATRRDQIENELVFERHG